MGRKAYAVTAKQLVELVSMLPEGVSAPPYPEMVFEDDGSLTFDGKRYEPTAMCENVSGVPLKFECSACYGRWNRPYGFEFNNCPSCGAHVRGSNG